MISRCSLFWLLLVLTPLVLAACSSTSDSLGRIHPGRTLMLTVLEMDRADELRYTTSDLRKWRMQPTKEGLELLLMRFKVENHTAVKAVFVADRQAAILRDFFRNEYRPFRVADTVYLDRRGQAEVTVTLEGGKCMDHPRVIVNAGTNVQWTNSGDTGSAIQFGPGALPELGAGPVQIEPGALVSHRFGQPGTFDYQCSAGDEPPQPAQVLVEDSGSVRGGRDKIILFLENTFELPMGTGVEGWMIFEVPIDTKIRDLRWRAGDSITIRF